MNGIIAWVIALSIVGMGAYFWHTDRDGNFPGMIGAPVFLASVIGAALFLLGHYL